ncbi:MAG TPA: TetR/AcrR family transcriptional regulator [Steroidobacter sp.]
MKARGATDCDTASSTRARLLEAAVKIVRETGGTRLRLDEVAHRAGVSKGGLLYHFPSKQSLLSTLVADYVQCMELRIAAASEAIDDSDDARALKARIVGLLGDNGLARWPGAALLVALANPPLMESIRGHIVSDARHLIASDAHCARAAVVALALDGVMLREALDVPGFSGEQHQALVDQLMKLADEA